MRDLWAQRLRQCGPKLKDTSGGARFRGAAVCLFLVRNHLCHPGGVCKVPAEGRSLRRRPVASSDLVRSQMSKQRTRDTHAELLVRKILHARGIRYRVDARPEPDYRCKADISWRALRLAVFIDGCFWHGCPLHATRPKANGEWWAQKLDTNVERDRRTDSELAARGWTVLRFWEHEEPAAVADAICDQLSKLRGKTSR